MNIYIVSCCSCMARIPLIGDVIILVYILGITRTNRAIYGQKLYGI